MIKEYAVARKQVVSFSIVYGLPEAVHLGATIRASRMEGCLFRLRFLDNLTVHLTAGSLIEPRRLVTGADRLQQPQRAKCVSVDSVDRHIETYPDVALRSEVVDFIRLDVVYDCRQIASVGQIAVYESELWTLVQVFVQMVDSARVKRRAAPRDAPDLVAFVQQQLGKI